MDEKIGRSRVQISQGRLFISTLISILGLMLKRSFRLIYIWSFSKRIVKLFQLWKSRVALALTLCCRPWYAHYSSISQNPSMVYIK
ncbi:unnamed protein product [Rotaria magnacalcarata]